MARSEFPHIATLRSEGADGKMRTYAYHRMTNVRIHAHPGTPEFAEEYRLASDGHKTKRGRRMIAMRRVRPPAPTNIYFIESTGTGLIKIGRAGDVLKRLSTMQTGSPSPLRLMCSIPDTSGGLLEEALHRRFAESRTVGEWFSPTPELLEHIAEEARRSRSAGVEVVEVTG